MTTAATTAPAATPVLVDWTTTRTDRATLLACTICDAAQGALCDPDRPAFCHAGRSWRVGITQIGMCTQRSATAGDLIARTPSCTPTIMVDKRWGRIVYVASENAVQSYADEMPYNVAKAALLNFTKGAKQV